MLPFRKNPGASHINHFPCSIYLSLSLSLPRGMVAECSQHYIGMGPRHAQTSLHQSRPPLGHPRAVGGIHRESLLRLVRCNHRVSSHMTDHMTSCVWSHDNHVIYTVASTIVYGIVSAFCS